MKKSLAIVPVMLLLLLGMPAAASAAEGDLVWSKDYASNEYLNNVVVDGNTVYASGSQVSSGGTLQWVIEGLSKNTKAFVGKYAGPIFAWYYNIINGMVVDETGIYVSGYVNPDGICFRGRVEKVSKDLGIRIWESQDPSCSSYTGFSMDTNYLYTLKNSGNAGAPSVTIVRLQKNGSPNPIDLKTYSSPKMSALSLFADDSYLYIGGNYLKQQGIYYVNDKLFLKRYDKNGNNEYTYPLLDRYGAIEDIVSDNQNVYFAGGVYDSAQTEADWYFGAYQKEGTKVFEKQSSGVGPPYVLNYSGGWTTAEKVEEAMSVLLTPTGIYFHGYQQTGPYVLLSMDTDACFEKWSYAGTQLIGRKCDNKMYSTYYDSELTGSSIYVTRATTSTVRPNPITFPLPATTGFSRIEEYGFEQPNCGQVTDIRDGNIYDTIQIGTQCWMRENMNVGTRINSTTAQTNNSTIEKYCYNNQDANCTSPHPTYPDGGLYTWDEAMQYTTIEGAQGICPTGWHIPTDAEWYALENYLKDSGQTCDANRSGLWDCSSAGTKMKSGGISGFEGNMAGFYQTGFLMRDVYTPFWSSSESGADAIGRVLDGVAAAIFRTSYSKTSNPWSMPVRCLQGAGVAPPANILQLCRENAPVAQGGGTYSFSLPTGNTTSFTVYYDSDVSLGNECAGTDVTASTTFTETNPTGGALTLSGANPKTFTGSSVGSESVTVSYSGASIAMNATVSCTETVNCNAEKAAICTGSTVPSGTTKAGTCGTVDCSNLPGTRYCDMNWKEVTPGF